MSTIKKEYGPFKIAGNGSNSEALIVSSSLKLAGTDFKIDSKARRKSKTPYRRALVHDFNDGLTINWAKDYPGGVTINGNVSCPNTLKIANKDVLKLITDLQNRVIKLEQLYKLIDWNAMENK